MISLYALGLLAAVQQDYAVKKPTVTVEARATVETPPDLATISFLVRGEGASSDDAASRLVEVEKRVYTALSSRSASLEFTDEEFQIRALHAPECENRSSDFEFDEDVVSYETGECAVAGYIASKSVTVRTDAIDDAGTLAGLASREGAFNAEVSSFGLKDSSQAKQAAIAQALADAKANANAIAAGSGMSLGAIASVSLDNASYGRGNDGIDFFAESNSARLAPRPVVEIGLKPDTVKTQAKVTVVYTLE